MTKNSFAINSREISSDCAPYIIAEISANHNGSVVRAKETILAARNAGVMQSKSKRTRPIQ